jgi:hypothetical protein
MIQSALAQAEGPAAHVWLTDRDVTDGVVRRARLIRRMIRHA